MRILRPILICLAVVAVFAAIFLVGVFLPPVQTWYVERSLKTYPGVQASVDSASVGFSSLHLEKVRLQRDAVILTLPALDATVPMKAALWDGQMRVRTLVAKGWTLDLSQTLDDTEEDNKPSGATPRRTGSAAPTSTPEKKPLEQKIVRELRGLLSGWELPSDASFDGVALEGDVVLPPNEDRPPERVHVAIQGGGMAAGRRGEFTLDASEPIAGATKVPHPGAAHGRLIVEMISPGRIGSLAFNGTVVPLEGAAEDTVGVSAKIVAAAGPTDESYTLEVNRGDRHLVRLSAAFAADQRRLKGTWKIDLKDTDLWWVHPGQSTPSFAGTGEGTFDTDPAFARLKVAGKATTALSRLGNVSPFLAAAGTGSLDADFTLTRIGPAIQVERLDLSFGATHPIVTARSLQPFSVDKRKAGLQLTDPDADWLEGTLVGLPPAWLVGLFSGVEFGGGELTGGFTVKLVNGEFTVHSKGPLVATGVSVHQASQPLGEALDLALTLTAEHTSSGWLVQTTPLTIASGGRRLATIEAKATPQEGARSRLAVAGTWDVDLQTLATQPAFSGHGPIADRSATGKFSVNVGNSTEIRSTINLVGPTPTQSMTANVRTLIDGGSGVVFQIPVTVTVGTNTSSLSVDGQWKRYPSGPRIELELTGVKVALDHLDLLGTSLSTWGLLAWPAFGESAAGANPAGTATRDPRPFWGDLIGHVKINFYGFTADGQEWNDVVGTLGFDHSALRLDGGQATIAPPVIPPVAERFGHSSTKADTPPHRVTVEGVVSFDAAAEFPYSLKGAAALDVVEASRLFTPAQAEHDPVLEGRFALTDTFTGQGATLPDLFSRRRDELRLTSKGGIIRLLKTDVAASIPEAPAPVTNTLVKAGALVGALFGVNKEAIDSGIKKLPKNTEAVLDFTSQTPEFRYDEFTFTATKDADQTIRLADIVITAANERLTGTGQIGFVKGQPLRSRPLKLDLKLGFQGHPAQLLSTAGLLSTDKDEKGYTLLRQPVEFGGTLEKIDPTAWHDLLVKGALPQAAPGKKGG